MVAILKDLNWRGKLYLIPVTPEQDQRPPSAPSFTQPRVYFVASLVFFSFARFLPLGYFFFRRLSNRSKYRDRGMTDAGSSKRAKFLSRETTCREMRRLIRRQSRLRNLCRRTSRRQRPSLSTPAVVILATCQSRRRAKNQSRRSSHMEPRSYPFNKLVVACRVKRAIGDVP